MALVNGKSVLASGVIHFVGSQLADTQTTPPLRFQASTTTAAGITSILDGAGIKLNVNLEPGANYCGFFDANLGTSSYRFLFSVERIGELPDGAFYEARYTIVLN